MNLLRNAFLGALALTFSLAFTQIAQAGPAEDFVRAKHANLTAELRKPASPARQAAVNQMLEGFFDFDRLTKEALGRHYDDLSPSEFNELKGLLQELVTKNYRKNIEKTLNFDVAFLGDDEVSGGQDRKIRTQATKRGSSDKPVEIEYVLHKKGDKWIVFDVITEGSSMLRTYRNQFGKTIRQDGFATLLAKLRERIEKS